MGDLRPAGSHRGRPGRRCHHRGHQQPAARHPMNTTATLHARPRRARSGRLGGDRGSASVEFAITAVAVMAIMFTAIQAATWYWARSIALAAAQEGVNAQRAYNAAPSAGQAKANAFIASTGDGLNDSTVTVT